MPLGNLKSYNTRPGEVVVLTSLYEENTTLNFAAFLATNQPYVVIDHSWFPELRTLYYRVVWQGFHRQVLPEEPPCWQRFHSLRLAPARPWQPRRPLEESRALLLTPTQRYARHFGQTETGIEEQMRRYMPPEVTATVRPRKGPHPMGPEEAIQTHDVVIGYNGSMLTQAMRLGVPAIDVSPCGMVRAFNGLDPSHIAPTYKGRDYLREKTMQDVEHFSATLATFYQVSKEELTQPGIIYNMVERQQHFAVPQPPSPVRPPQPAAA